MGGYIKTNVKYKKQSEHQIKLLKEEIERWKLADEICKARYEKGIDRIPYDINVFKDKVDELWQRNFSKDTIYMWLVSHYNVKKNIYEDYDNPNHFFDVELD